MAIGRTFKEALQKGIRSLEPSTPWRAPAETPDSLLREKLATPRPNRIHWILTAVERGMPARDICELTKIDPWFIHQIEEIIQVNRRAAAVTVETASKELLRDVKRIGTSDEHLAQFWKTTPAAVRLQRARYGVGPGLQTRGHLRRGVRILHAVHVLHATKMKTNPIPRKNRKS